MPTNDKSTIRTVTTTRVVDANGRVISTTTSEEQKSYDELGNSEHHRTYEKVVLADGSVYSSAMSVGQQPVMLTAVCGVCSQEFDKAAAERCKHCGICLCPKHAYECEDGHRCKRHWRRHVAWRTAKALGRTALLKKRR